MPNHKGYFNINIIVLVTLALMVSFWLLATPKIDILKAVQDLPKLTAQKMTNTTSSDPQNSQVNKKPVVDSAAAAKLSTKSVKSSQDLDSIGKDLDSSNIDNVDNSINQIETDVE